MNTQRDGHGDGDQHLVFLETDRFHMPDGQTSVNQFAGGVDSIHSHLKGYGDDELRSLGRSFLKLHRGEDRRHHREQDHHDAQPGAVITTFFFRLSGQILGPRLGVPAELY
ncbi:MAG: hypothetical protein CBC35_03725 [Planctomycetes bacterium TMED75]|nr:hypothetical protein [Planctomycetaceae bacterium]OUU94599.1 MAG: hypothetical protein CBC35_03725 [Planctomycetes bacterium TMED75]